MTKTVRIENADVGKYRVRVEVWDKGYPEGAPDTFVKFMDLHYPASMLAEYITSTRYLIVKELPELTSENTTDKPM